MNFELQCTLISHAIYVAGQLLRLKMFREDHGSWMTMFFSTILFLFIFSHIYNTILLMDGNMGQVTFPLSTVVSVIFGTCKNSVLFLVCSSLHLHYKYSTLIGIICAFFFFRTCSIFSPRSLQHFTTLNCAPCSLGLLRAVV